MGPGRLLEARPPDAAAVLPDQVHAALAVDVRPEGHGDLAVERFERLPLAAVGLPLHGDLLARGPERHEIARAIDGTRGRELALLGELPRLRPALIGREGADADGVELRPDR